MASDRAIEMAAKVWCFPETSEKEMDVVLAKKFSEILDEAFTAKEAMKSLSTIMEEDPDYAWAWHYAIAISSMDKGLSHQKSNEAAADFMNIFFGLRMREHYRYIFFKEQWKKEENPE